MLRTPFALLNVCRERRRKLLQPCLAFPRTLVVETLQMTFGRPNKITKSLMDQVRAVKPMQNFDVDAFITFSNLVQSLVTTMTSLNCRSHLSNPQLLEELLAKIPTQNQLTWCMQ